MKEMIDKINKNASEITLIVLLLLVSALVTITYFETKNKEHQRVEGYVVCIKAGASEDYCSTTHDMETYPELRSFVGGK